MLSHKKFFNNFLRSQDLVGFFLPCSITFMKTLMNNGSFWDQKGISLQLICTLSKILI